MDASDILSSKKVYAILENLPEAHGPLYSFEVFVAIMQRRSL